MRKVYEPDEELWEEICLLLERGRSFHDIFRILKTKKNERVLDYLEYSFVRGESLENIVSKMKGKIPEYLRFFLKFMTAKESLRLSLSFSKFEKKMREKIIKIFMYPAFLVLMSLTVLFVFSFFILPEFESFAGPGSRDAFTAVFFLVIRILALSLSAGGVSAVCMMILRKRNYPLFRAVLSKTPVRRLIRTADTYLFSKMAAELFKKGIPGAKIFGLLGDIKGHPETVYLAKRAHEQLMRGIPFSDVLKDPAFDDLFSRMTLIGYESGTFVQSLEHYLVITEVKIAKMTQRLSVIVQIAAYVFLGITVLIVYRAMMMPLDMINDIS